MPTLITDTLANFTVNTSTSDISKSALKIAKLSILDWLAVSIAGADEPVSKIVRDMIEGEGGTAQASVFGSSRRFPARAAALANGTISHALDYDDTHFLHIGHPSVGIIPAALAVAQQTGSSREEWIEAALMGMEASCRVGDWLGRSHYQQGFHQTATSGSIGSTVAAAHLLKLDTEQTRYALGLAATRTSGLKCQFGTMAKPYHAGMAAANGVEAARLAKAGFVSRADGLECEQGLSWTHHGELNESAFEGLGDTYVFEAVQHKFHACCHGTHAALEAIIEARDSHQIDADSIEKIEIHVNKAWLTVCDIPEPNTGLEIKFSYRMTSAMVLHHYDTAAITTFDNALCSNPVLVTLRDKVLAIADETLSETQANVTITLTSGKTLTVSHDLTDPMSYETRAKKVKEKAETLLGQVAAENFWAVINEDNTDLALLAPMMALST